MKAVLYSASQGHSEFARLWGHAKPLLMAGHRLALSLTDRTRSADQNARLHALLGEISEQIEWAGAKRDIETWKRLLTAAWGRVQGEQPTILPALDGHGFDVLYRRTSQLTVSECSDLMEFVQAWAAERGVVCAE